MSKTEAEKKGFTNTQRIARLENIVAKMCHYSGSEHILTEFGLEKWAPGKKDMSRWADVKDEKKVG